MFIYLTKFKKTKLVLIISSLLCSSLILASVSIDKVINLKAGQSINVDNLMITCQSSSVISTSKKSVSSFSTNTIDKNIAVYKNTRDIQADFCGSFVYQSDKKKCLATKTKYLEPKAIELCKSLPFTSDKLKCLGTIKDKVYSDNEIKTIKSMPYTSDKLNTLDQSGANIDSM